MGFLDRLLGRRPRQHQDSGYAQYPAPPPPSARNRPTDDEAAIERYRYLLRTAPPDALEEAHAEAFTRLTPEQRQQVLTELGSQVPESERATSDDPRALARMATRAEVRQPGTLERTFSRGGPGMGMGGMLAGSLFGSLAGAFVGTAIASQLFDESDAGMDEQASETGEQGDAGGGEDAASGDYGSGDFGGGGGDFGGGDFGGGDMGGW